MSGLFNGLFGDPQAQTLQAQQNAQQGAQQYQAQIFAQMMQQQQQSKQQAMQELQKYLQSNPNPATQWGSVVGPGNTAPQTVGGGSIGANGQVTGAAPAGMSGDPNTLALLAALLKPATNKQSNPGSNLGIPAPAPKPTQQPAPGGTPGGSDGLMPRLAQLMQQHNNMGMMR